MILCSTYTISSIARCKMVKHTLGEKLCSRWFKIYWRQHKKKSTPKISNISQSLPQGMRGIFLPERFYFNIWFSCLHQKCILSFLPECKENQSVYRHLRLDFSSLLPQSHAKGQTRQYGRWWRWWRLFLSEYKHNHTVWVCLWARSVSLHASLWLCLIVNLLLKRKSGQ